MKKRYGIGFLIAFIFLTLMIVCAYQLSYDRAVRKRQIELNTLERKQEHVISTEGKTQKEDGYFIKEKDGYVIVYYSDAETVYEYTTIESRTLPKNIQEELKTGKMLESVKEVYGFLENYSS